MKIDWRGRLAVLRQLLILTKKEKEVLVFVLTAFLLGVVVKHYRETHPALPPPVTDTSALQKRGAAHSAIKRKTKSRPKTSPLSTPAAPADDDQG